MDKDKLTELFNEVLENLARAEESGIYETSGSVQKDLEESKADIEKLKQRWEEYIR